MGNEPIRWNLVTVLLSCEICFGYKKLKFCHVLLNCDSGVTLLWIVVTLSYYVELWQPRHIMFNCDSQGISCWIVTAKAYISCWIVSTQHQLKGGMTCLKKANNLIFVVYDLPFMKSWISSPSLYLFAAYSPEIMMSYLNRLF